MMSYESPPHDQMSSIILTDSDPVSPPPESNGSQSFPHDPLSQSPNPNPNPNSINSILEPPSYAEAIFTSFDSDPTLSPSSPNANGHDLPNPISPSTSPYHLKISVSDPKKEIEPSGSLVSGSYFSYLITTYTNIPEYNGSEFNVRRRFKDVVALADKLSESFRGCFVPVRPDKSVVEGQVMQKAESVEQRRSDLEKYLRRLSAHPVIRRSEELRVFLEASDRMQLVVGDGGVSKVLGLRGVGDGTSGTSGANESPVKGGRDYLWLFKELKQSVSNDWGGVKPLVVEDDKEFLERKEKLQDFEIQISNVSQQVDSLIDFFVLVLFV